MVQAVWTSALDTAAVAVAEYKRLTREQKGAQAQGQGGQGHGGPKAGPKKTQKVTRKVSEECPSTDLAVLHTDACFNPQFIIDATKPSKETIFDVAAFEKFLHDRIKVDGRTGNLGDKIVIAKAGEGKLEITAHQEFSGRYIKYL